jgi:cytochrome c
VGSTTTVKYRSWDVAGNTEDTKSQVVRIDGAPPKARIKFPADGSSFHAGDMVRIRVAARDRGTGGGPPSGVVSAVFYLDGTTVLGTDLTAPYRLKWRITQGVPLGQHTLTVLATDAAGNSTTSVPIAITVTARPGGE